MRSDDGVIIEVRIGQDSRKAPTLELILRTTPTGFTRIEPGHAKILAKSLESLEPLMDVFDQLLRRRRDKNWEMVPEEVKDKSRKRKESKAKKMVVPKKELENLSEGKGPRGGTSKRALKRALEKQEELEKEKIRQALATKLESEGLKVRKKN